MDNFEVIKALWAKQESELIKLRNLITEIEKSTNKEDYRAKYEEQLAAYTNISNEVMEAMNVHLLGYYSTKI